MYKQNRYRVALIGSVGIPGNYGGFETLAQQLVEKTEAYVDWQVYCSAPAFPKSRRTNRYLSAKLIYLHLQANGWQAIPYDSLSILHSLRRVDLLLVLGNASAPLFPLVKRFTKLPIISHIDGMEWTREKWSRPVQKYLRWAESLAVKYADLVIADNEGIQEYVDRQYNRSSSLIAYGSDHAQKVFPKPDDLSKYSFLGRPYAVKVCRIEPENQIEMVLQSFSMQTNLALVLIGNWKSNPYGKRLKERFQNYPHIHLLDPIYNPDELNLIRSQASLYVHGHKAGGTNPSLVEAMNLGLGVIASDVNYNRYTTENKALYFQSTEQLTNYLETNSINDFSLMGQEMLEIALRKYQWAIVARQYTGLIRQLLDFDKSPANLSQLSIQ